MTLQEGHNVQIKASDRSMALREPSHFLRNLMPPQYLRQPIAFALLLLMITSLSTLAYYLTFPQIDLNADTPAYLGVVERFLAHPDLLVDPGRLPVYPLFVSLIYVLLGHGNLAAVSVVQAGLFVLMTLEVYVIALLILKRAWLAFVLGLLVGTNITLLAYAKPIMTEGLAALFLTTLALAITCYIRTMRVRALWCVTAALLLLLFTRPEWLYLPVLLFAYLLLVTLRRKNSRPLLHYGIVALLSLVIIYGCVFAYVERNAVQNHYQGFTAIENYNELGKILQYHMQDEAPSQEQAISQRLDACIAHIDTDPYHVLPCVPALTDAYRYDVPAGAFARSIILHHPAEFLLKSLPLFFTSLIDYYDAPYHTNIPASSPLAWLHTLHRAFYWLNACFPLCAVAWLFLLCWRRTASRQDVLAMGVIVLLVVYGIIVTTLGGYRTDDYMRVHIVFDPLLILVVWGSLLKIACYFYHAIKTWYVYYRS